MSSTQTYQSKLEEEEELMLDELLEDELLLQSGPRGT